MFLGLLSIIWIAKEQSVNKRFSIMFCDSSFWTEEQKDNKSSNRMHLALMFLSLLITHLHKSHVLMFFCLVTESSAKITNCFHFSIITHHFFAILSIQVI